MPELEAEQLTNEIMTNIDANHDGTITIDEFSNGYIEIIKKLRQRMAECEDKMIDSYE